MGYKILIGTWGKPDLWKETTYRFNNVSNRSATSLLTLKEAIKPDKIVIIALDTICDSVPPSGSVLTYSDINKSCQGKLENFCIGNNLKPDRIIIAPGNGTFSGMTFTGNMQDYFYITFYQLVKIFLEVIWRLLKPVGASCPDSTAAREKNKHFDQSGDNHNCSTSDETIEIHLDLTHGINFMPTLTYRALKEIISMIEVFMNAEFHVYNSEPYFQGRDLEIHVIERSAKLRPLFPMEFIENQIMLLEHYRCDELSEEIKKEKKNIRKIGSSLNVDEINTFFSSLMYGLLLVLVSLFPDPEKIKDTVERAVNYFQEMIIVANGNPVTVRRKLSLTEHFGTVLKAHFLSECLRMRGIVRNLEVSLSELKQITKTVFRKFPLLTNLINNELYSIEPKIKSTPTFSWDFLINLDKRNQGPPDFRNFMAHAGMEKNLTMVKKKNNEIKLKYDDIRIKNVQGFARMAMEIKNI